MAADDQSFLSKYHINENLLQDLGEKTSQQSNYSLIQSLQNIFHRWMKSSSTSNPSTERLSHSDKINFRIRPFPMSSYDQQSHTMNPSNSRFYHVFKRGELESLIEEASKSMVGLKINQIFYDHGNWCAIVEKDLNNHSE